MSVAADEVADAMGVGRNGMRWWRLMALAQLPLMFGFGMGWAWEIYTEPTVVPQVIWVDRDNMRVLAVATSANATDRQAAYTIVAKLWVWNIRSRSPDASMNMALEREAQKYTAKKAFPAIKAMLERVNDELGADEDGLGGDGIEVGATTQAIVRSIEKDQAGNEFAIVDVTWHERRYGAKGGVGDTFGFYAKLKIMEGAPDRTGEVPPNPFGRYIVDYKFEETGKVERFAEAVP